MLDKVVSDGEKMIKSRLKVLIAEKEVQTGKRLSYKTISADTGLSTSTLTRLATQDFDRIDNGTIEALCRYFSCQVGDLIYWDGIGSDS